MCVSTHVYGFLLQHGFIRHTVNKITFSEQCYYVFGDFKAAANSLPTGMMHKVLHTVIFGQKLTYVLKVQVQNPVITWIHINPLLLLSEFNNLQLSDSGGDGDTLGPLPGHGNMWGSSDGEVSNVYEFGFQGRPGPLSASSKSNSPSPGE